MSSNNDHVTNSPSDRRGSDDEGSGFVCANTPPSGPSSRDGVAVPRSPASLRSCLRPFECSLQPSGVDSSSSAVSRSAKDGHRRALEVMQFPPRHQFVHATENRNTYFRDLCTPLIRSFSSSPPSEWKMV